ncbi:MAG TPA: NUDIX hydrolase [Trebonia sp.]|jgi:8-oxo-dGTP pyrophosphatase MutT (NUDIX family)
MATALHSVSVSAVIVDDQGRVLLTQRRDNSHWEAPGGVLEVDEDIATGLRREVLEETGLTVEPIALTGVYKNMSRPIVALVFRCKATGGQLRLNDEVTAFRWATVNEVNEAVDETFAVRIADGLADSPRPAVRQHDGTHLL